MFPKIVIFIVSYFLSLTPVLLMMLVLSKMPKYDRTSDRKLPPPVVVFLLALVAAFPLQTYLAVASIMNDPTLFRHEWVGLDAIFNSVRFILWFAVSFVIQLVVGAPLALAEWLNGNGFGPVF